MGLKAKTSAFRWRVMRHQIGKKGKKNEVREGASKTGRSMVAGRQKDTQHSDAAFTHEIKIRMTD